MSECKPHCVVDHGAGPGSCITVAPGRRCDGCSYPLRSWSERCPRCGAPSISEWRLRSACEAMANFCSWIWVEATVRRQHRNGSCAYRVGSDFAAFDCECRAAILAQAIQYGLFTLSWPAPKGEP